MPYIKKEKREVVLPFTVHSAECAGDLNYVFTKFIISYVERKGLNYQVVNDIVGALEGAKIEFYRRIASDYEDLKIAQNGDVYETNSKSSKVQKSKKCKKEKKG